MLDIIPSESNPAGIQADNPTTKPFSCTLVVCIAFHCVFWLVTVFVNFFAGAVFGAYMLFFGAIAFVIDLIRLSGVASKEAKQVLGKQILIGVVFNNYGVLLASAFAANYLIALFRHH